MILLNFVLPMILLGIRRFRTVVGTAVASFTIVIGMWIERFLIIVPTLANPRLSFVRGHYSPTWVEVTITAGTVAYFGLLYLLFTKLFPIVSIWELKEDLRLQSHDETLALSPEPIRPASAPERV